MFSQIGLLAVTALLGLNVQQSISSSAPTVTVRNGTYTGLHSDTYNEDYFLGMPFAQPPLNTLRLALPQSLNTSWQGSKPATTYYPACVGYGGDDIGYNVSEDCLALNVVRPSGYEGQSLPVGVWIHGGGYVMGSTVDRRYNLSFIVDNSVKIGKPIIAVSIAYRLSGWGFLDSKEVRAAGVTNLGIQDQRIALYWIQENIAAFGGDPEKVTIWGESAGAGSVGIHLIAYGGRNDGLFRGAMCESGNSILLGPANYDVTEGQVLYDNITAAVGCSSSSDSLECLRTVNYNDLNTALNKSFPFYPYNDGSLIQGSQYDQLTSGQFIKVPLLSGANTDEGTAFGPQGINNDTDFATYLTSTGGKDPLDNTTVSILEAVYPNLPAASDVLYELPLNYSFNSTFGYQYRRAVAFGGDFAMHAARRLQCQSWAQQNISAYCYRFNVVVNGIPNIIGSTHFQEVAFVFNNLEGLGYAENPFQGEPQTYANLSQLMSRMWASFIYDGNPNGHNLSGYPDWPVYDIVQGGGVGQDYFFDTNTTSHPEPDSWRADGIKYLNSLWKSAYGR